MAVHYVPFDGGRVSGRWLTVLRQARKEGVRFHVTSGHRTMAEQMRLFRQNMQFVNGRWVRKPGHPLTAFPSPLAPHIRTGNPAHALDVDSLDGGETRLQKWLERQGVHPTNPVQGEAWHLELSRAELTKLYRRFRAKPAQRMSEKGIEFLIREEGIVPYAYNDPAGHATFGVGHLLHRGPVTDSDRKRWGTKQQPKSREVAISVLKQDLVKHERGVREAVGRRLYQHQFDAFVSLSFNIGTAGFKGSTAAKRSRQRLRRAAANAILLWDKPAMLRPRRERERRLFLEGKYR